MPCAGHEASRATGSIRGLRAADKRGRMRAAPHAAVFLSTTLRCPCRIPSSTGPSAGALLALAVALPARAEGTARSIDCARGVLKTPGRAVYDREIRGAAQPDGLGVRLPEGFTAKGLLAALVPGGDPPRRCWPGPSPGRAPGQLCGDRLRGAVCRGRGQ